MNHEPDITRNRHGGNEESTEARDSLDPGTVKTMRERVFRCFDSFGPEGVITEVVTRRLVMRTQTCTARVSELKAEGRLHPTGVRGTTSSGRSAMKLSTTAPAPQVDETTTAPMPAAPVQGKLW